MFPLSRIHIHSGYFLEDAIEMLHFIPPLQDKKKKKSREPGTNEEEDDAVMLITYMNEVMMTSDLMCIRKI